MKKPSPAFESNKIQAPDIDKRHSRARRRLLQSLAAGGAAVTVKALPEKWAKPALDTTILPAHAQATCQLQCEVTDVEGGTVRRLPELPWPGGSSNNEIDRFTEQSGVPLCGGTGGFEFIIDDISVGVAATIDPSCGTAYLAASLSGSGTSVFTITSGGGTELGSVNPNTGSVSFNPVTVSFDPTNYTINTPNTVLSAELDLRVQAPGANDCVIDINFTERFLCSPPA